MFKCFYVEYFLLLHKSDFKEEIVYFSLDIVYNDYI